MPGTGSRTPDSKCYAWLLYNPTYFLFKNICYGVLQLMVNTSTLYILDTLLCSLENHVRNHSFYICET